jgi:hypothetical protein
VIWHGTDLYLGSRKVGGIVPVARYPGMWRVLHPNGTLTDMVNLSGAKETAKTIAARELNEEVA